MKVTHAELIKVAHGLSQIRGMRYQVFGYRVRGQYETGWIYAVSPTLADSKYKPSQRQVLAAEALESKKLDPTRQG
jgi:hypothetical protein